MVTYFDTSLLLKIYVREIGSPEALAIIEAETPPVIFSHLLELELRTALRIKHGRGELSVTELRSVMRTVSRDLTAGVLMRPSYELEAVYHRAEVISAKHASATLSRSADIWHIAAALELGCRRFATFDLRQPECADRVGLEVLPVGRRSRGK